MTRKIKIGIIGTGNICPIYIKTIKSFDFLDLTACADIDTEKAIKVAREFGIPCACSIAELLSDAEIEIVLNLTPPGAHSEVSLKILQNKKSVYSEKPLSLTKVAAQKMIGLAGENQLRVGCAPDTFLGAGLQTCRKLIDEGAIGQPVAATAFMLNHGHENWHPDPEFYYKAGGGPLLDMGPYYLTALVSLLGPVARVAGSSQISFAERTISSQPRVGDKIKVEVPTHITGLLEFSNGAIGTLITSFDVWGHTLPHIEIYGSQGTLFLPDPNTFGGPVRLLTNGAEKPVEIPLVPGYVENSRGLGVAEMAAAMQSDRIHCANEQLAYHILDIMLAILESASVGQHVSLATTCTRPAPLPVGLLHGSIGMIENHLDK
jgi:predicted dehydrogenase